MFIELTDHLRCPADHEEAYLVLLPDVVEKRDVRSGKLGCPVCNWETTFADGVVDFGAAVPRLPPRFPSKRPAFLGLSGPGGLPRSWEPASWLPSWVGLPGVRLFW
jgi:hypothetical protein